MCTEDTGVCCPCVRLLKEQTSQTRSQSSSSEISQPPYWGVQIQIRVYLLSPFPFCLFVVTCLVVEGSSCALDLVCVVLPCPVIGSRLLAAACAGGLQPGHNPSVVSYGELSAMPSHAYCYPTQLCDRTPLPPGQCAISLHFQVSNGLLNNVWSRLLRGN